NQSIVLLNYGICRGKAETAPGLLSCEIGIEYLLDIVWRDSHTLVLNVDSNVFSRHYRDCRVFVNRAVLSLYGNRAPFRHGLKSIDEQVVYYLTDLSRINLDAPQVMGNGKFVADARSSQVESGAISSQFSHGRWRLYFSNGLTSPLFPMTHRLSPCLSS